MASKVTPYFILTAEGLGSNETPNVCDETREQTDDEKSTEIVKYKKQPMVNNLTRKELTRKRMEFIQQKLEESRARHAEKQKTLSINLRPIPRVGDSFMPRTPHTYVIPDTSQKPQQDPPPKGVEMVPLSVSRRSPTNSDMPYVYFVVSVDRLQRSKTDLSSSSYDDNSLGSSLSGNSSVKKRNKLLSRSQRRKKKQEDDFPTVSKSDGNFSNGKKQIVTRKHFPFFYGSSPVIPPPTPATVTTYNMQDRADDECHTDRHLSVGDLRDFNDNRTNQPGKASPPRLIELPYISGDLQRKNLGSSNSSMEGKAMEVYRKTLANEPGRKVHFAEGFDLPNIRGGGMGIPRGLISDFGARPNTMPTIMSGREDFERYMNAPIPRTAFGTPRSRKPGQPLNLPKIDIVSGVYDELIVKAIEAYINEFPPNSKQGKVARQLLQQLHERTITTNDLANMEKKPHGHGLKIKELDPEIPRGNEMSGSKTSRGHRRPVKPKADGEFSTLAPTCFQMVAPGTLSARDEVTVVSLK
ncbi:uncharacterized protein LOC134283090 [Saccostrea cucullata]|uniref:uncharacterized protein LOC134283090 n=1 Tax=Saccostrea cuccullata TaxID=36930 RepID=UPI002ED2ADBC